MSKPVTLRALSLGAGVQSTTLALLAEHGELDARPEVAIFADTKWEPPAVYRHLDWLEQQLSFPVRRVSESNLREDLLNGVNSTGQAFISVPVFIPSPATGAGVISKRQCTREYKIKPIQRALRAELGMEHGQRLPKATNVEQWIGISTDEIRRVKPSRDWWITHRWPLIDGLGWSRADCQRWFRQRYPGRALVKSACIGCPYHDDRTWSRMRDEDPTSWRDAVQVDTAMKRSDEAQRRFAGRVFLHQSMRPLDQVKLRRDAPQLSLFDDECEGLCGV